MRKCFSRTVAGCLVLLAGHAPGQLVDSGFGFLEPERGPCLLPEHRAAIETKLSASITSLRAAGRLPSLQAQMLAAQPVFRWPIQGSTNVADYGYHGISGFVDQTTNSAGYSDFNCGTRSYDGHKGTDIFTWPFQWRRMDYSELQIVAAAAGTIVYKADGNTDRSCAWTNFNWNAVYVQHADGSVAWYGHMKNGSLTTSIVGAAVAEGQYLGVVGSSGMSSGPHLHFEVHDASNRLVDPWSGACNPTSTNTWWQSQRPYHDSAINKLSTHTANMVVPSCPGQETPNTNDVFNPGATVYFYAFYRDQLAGDVSTNTVVRPDGSMYTTWTTPNSTYYSASYWWSSYTLSASQPRGSWYYRVAYRGSNYEHRFFLGSADAALAFTPAPPAAVLGSNLVLNLRVTNNTAAYATYLTISNPLPAGCSFVSAGPGGTFAGGVVSWAVTGLAANASTQLSLTILFTNAGPVAAITNAARVATGTFDTNTANDAAGAVIPVDHDGDGLPTGLEAAGDGNSNGVPAYLDAAETFNLTAIATGSLSTWAAFSGAVYQLQFTTNLLPPAAWSDLGGSVTAQSPALTVGDTNTAAQRIYRVLLQRLP